MRENFSKILNSRMVAITLNSQFEVFLLSKYSKKLRVLSKNRKPYLSYESTDDKQKVSTTIVEETILPCGAEVCLDIPHFYIYITGDLAFYANILGKPNICPLWYHLCDKSHKEWNNVRNISTGNLWSITTMQKTYETYKQQWKANKIVVTCIRNKMHFPNSAPQNFICPPLHIMIGLVDKIWQEMIDWITDDLENIEEAEANDSKTLNVTNITQEKIRK